MNLNEQISRIHEMMGVNPTDVSLSKVRRRLDKLPEYVKSAYMWLNATKFNSFDSFLQRVIFSTLRNFVTESGINAPEIGKIMVEIGPFIREYIMDNHLDEIENDYKLQRGETSVTP